MSHHPPAIVRRRPGFTLIELLVVVSIIAVLAGLLLPAIGMVRRSAQVTRFASHLRQVGVGMHAYANENEDRFPAYNVALKPAMPHDIHWYALVATYVGDPDPGDYALTQGLGTEWASQAAIKRSVLRDPADTSVQGNGLAQRNVAINGEVTSSGTGTAKGASNRLRASIRAAGELMLAAPGAANSHAATDSEWLYGARFASNRIVANAHPISLYCRYGTSVPLVYADGHVQAVATAWLWDEVAKDNATGTSRLLDRNASNP